MDWVRLVGFYHILTEKVWSSGSVKHAIYRIHTPRFQTNISCCLVVTPVKDRYFVDLIKGSTFCLQLMESSPLLFCLNNRRDLVFFFVPACLQSVLLSVLSFLVLERNSVIVIFSARQNSIIVSYFWQSSVSIVPGFGHCFLLADVSDGLALQGGDTLCAALVDLLFSFLTLEVLYVTGSHRLAHFMSLF